MVGGGEGVADVDAFDAVDGADVAAGDGLGFLGGEAFEGVDGADFAGVDGAVLLDEGDGGGGVEGAAVYAADADAAGVVGVVEGGDLELERAFEDGRAGDVLEDGVE